VTFVEQEAKGDPTSLITRQLDVETAYLNARSTITNYIKFSEGYDRTDPDAIGIQVTKALYGLTQSARE
jgi:methyl coenzyme M reductase subunit D